MENCVDLTNDDKELPQWTCAICTFAFNAAGTPRCECCTEFRHQNASVNLAKQLSKQLKDDDEAASVALVQHLMQQQQQHQQHQQHHHHQQQQQQQHQHQHQHQQHAPSDLQAASLALAQQLALTPSINPALLQRLRERRFWKGRVLNNRLRPNEEDDISFLDIVDPNGLERALVTSFGFHPTGLAGIFGECLAGRHHPEFDLALIDNYDRTRMQCGLTPSFPPFTERIVHIRPHFETSVSNHFGKYGLQVKNIYISIIYIFIYIHD